MNILIHGKPGSGKTMFRFSFAALFNVKTTIDDVDVTKIKDLLLKYPAPMLLFSQKPPEQKEHGLLVLSIEDALDILRKYDENSVQEALSKV